MLDIKYVRENQEAVQAAARNKNIDLNVAELLEVDDKRKTLIVEVDQLRSERNELAADVKTGKPTAEQIEKGRKLKEMIGVKEEELKEVEQKYLQLMACVPMVPAEDVPVGKDDSENVEVEKWGEPTRFDFEPKNHIQLGRELDIIDFERGVKVSGYRGYYMKNEGVSLQMALMMYALKKLIQKGFQPMIPPTLVKEFVLFGSGYFSGKELSS